jgi:hypothetical protein
MLGVQGRRQGPGVWAGDGQSGLCGGAQAWGRPTDGAVDGQVRQKMVDHQARQRPKPAQILEDRDERGEPGFSQNGSQDELDAKGPVPGD